MPPKRIHTRTSRTAEWTCLSRAASSLERDVRYRCGDTIALRLVPTPIRYLLHIAAVRRIFTRWMMPLGIYEYTIARTKYIDGVFEDALDAGLEQALILGAGFDSRALRFHRRDGGFRVFELDVPVTQQAKLGQYARRGLRVPESVTFIAIDFDRERLPDKLDRAGFVRGKQSLFVLEGLLMYLQPLSVAETLRVLQDVAGQGSVVVFDYVRASVLRGEGSYYGQKQIMARVAGAGESWHFGLEEDAVEEFLNGYGFTLDALLDASALERMYFAAPSPTPIGRVNATHCLVKAIKA